MWSSVAFHSLFWLLSKCFYQLSQMKTNFSIIPSHISKPSKTFLDWVTTFHFARFVHTQCKHHFSGCLFSLHKDNTKFFHTKAFPKKHFWHFCPFSAWPFSKDSLQTFSFFLQSSTSFTTNPSWEWKFQNIIVTSIFESLMS